MHTSRAAFISGADLFHGDILTYGPDAYGLTRGIIHIHQKTLHPGLLPAFM